MMEYWNNDLKKMIFLYLISVNRNFTITQLSIFPEPNIDGLVKRLKTVVPDLIRHPELIEFTGFRLSPE